MAKGFHKLGVLFLGAPIIKKGLSYFGVYIGFLYLGKLPPL